MHISCTSGITFIISTICFSNDQKTYSGVLAGQVSAQDKDQALKKLKDALQKVKIDPNMVPGAPIYILGTCYVMSVKEGKGLVWTQLSKLAATTELSIPDLEKLEVDLFKKVGMCCMCNRHGNLSESDHLGKSLVLRATGTLLLHICVGN